MQTILQMSRYASVEYVALRQARRYEMAEKHLTMLMLVSTFFASGMAAFVVADNGRLASLLLKEMNLPIYQMVAITFGLGNAFYCFQICVGVCRRSGEVAEIAHRQYFYILCAALFAVIALVTKSMVTWLSLMMVARRAAGALVPAHALAAEHPAANVGRLAERRRGRHEFRVRVLHVAHPASATF